MEFQRPLEKHRNSEDTPDFDVWHLDGLLTLIEVKGYLRDDATVKLKACREMYPHFRWRMVRRTKGDWLEYGI